LSTKIHATVDALGNPTAFHLTPGQASDLEGADALLADTPAQTVIADKAFDADERVIENPCWLRKSRSSYRPGRTVKRSVPTTGFCTRSGI